jgi:hypothetical protein
MLLITPFYQDIFSIMIAQQHRLEFLPYSRIPQRGLPLSAALKWQDRVKTVRVSPLFRRRPAVALVYETSSPIVY